MSFFIFHNRSLIPNWRDFRKTIALSELSESMGALDKRDFKTLIPYISDWREYNTISHAGELISNAFTIGLTQDKDVRNAAEFLIKNAQGNASLLGISKKILDVDRSEKVSLTDYSSFEDYNSSLNDNSIYKQISFIKRILQNQSRNAVRWVELSRLYAIVGNNIKAEKAMVVALGLSQNNRYISRSATRLFCHMNDSDKALYYLRKNSGLTHDPWILASELGANRYTGKSSRHVKRAIQILNNDKYDSFDLCELSSAVATEEYINGKRKNSKNLFRKSLLKPNDNTVAQAEWMASVDKSYIIDVDYTSILNPFEAQSTLAYINSKWKLALEYAKSWFLDMPFSSRAAVFGSYIASLIEDYDSMEEFCHLSVQSNPTDISLLNNLAYALAQKDKLLDAVITIKRMNLVNMSSLKPSDYISVNATLGLIRFRQGELVAGRDYYNKSVEKAKEKGYHHYALLGQIHLINEEMRSGNSEIGPLLDSCERMIKKHDFHDTNFLWQKIINRVKPPVITV